MTRVTKEDVDQALVRVINQGTTTSIAEVAKLVYRLLCERDEFSAQLKELQKLQKKRDKCGE